MFAKLLGRQRQDPELGSTPSGSAASEADPKLPHPESDDNALSLGPNGQKPGDELLDDEGRPIPPWQSQVTVRAIFAGACLSVLFCIMVLKLAFTVGIIPSLNIAAGLLGFVTVKSFTQMMLKLNWTKTPFTQQENTVIQTTVVAAYSLAFSGGFSSFLLGMDWNTYLQSADGSEVNGAYGDPPQILPPNVIEPNLGKLIGFMFVIAFAGILVLVPMRKVMIIDYRLTFPSGTATGIMIKGFHTPLGQAIAKAQVKTLGKWGGISFGWSLFKWFFSGFGDACGFDNFPSLGFSAKYWKWYFDFSQTYVGIGMICPIQVTYSLMVGAILSYGIMWPLLERKQGDWFPAGTSYGEGGSKIQGLNGYKTFVAVAWIVGDGLFNIVRIFIITIASLIRGPERNQRLPMTNGQGQHVHAHPTEQSAATEDDEARLKNAIAPAHQDNPEAIHVPALNRESITPEEALRVRELRDKVFMLNAIPNWMAVTAYVCLAAISIGVTPQIWPGVKAYYMVVCYLLAPFFAFCNAYGMGLTDWSLLTTYGKVAIFIFAGWGGSNGGVIAGLATGTALAVIVGAAADLMQDFKTGWLTFSSPRAMFVAQMAGMACGCFIAPLTFWLYWKGFVLGDPDGAYPAPFAALYRNMAVVAVEGSKALPRHCLQICAGVFAAAILINIIRVYCVKPWVRKYIPIPMCLGIPAYLGPYFVIDMTVGACILATYRWISKIEARRFAPIIASALIAGDGIWTVVSAILALAGAVAPVCMTFTHGNQATVSNLEVPTS